MIRAVIFDMDGVVSDTEKIQAQVTSELLSQNGIDVSPQELTRRFAGVPDEQTFQILFSEFHKPIQNIQLLIEQRWKKVMELAKGNIREMPGSRDLIFALKNHHYILGLASSSILHFIETVLNALKLKDIFDAITSGQEVKNGKPHPDIFLLMAKKLAVRPRDCVVIEDGKSGMVAAKNAGMKCIGLVSEVHNKTYEADIIVGDLREIRLEVFEKW